MKLFVFVAFGASLIASICATSSIIYTVLTPENSKGLHCSSGDFSSFKIKKSRPTKVILPSYGSNENCSWAQQMTQEYLKYGKFNLFVVNYDTFMPTCVTGKVIDLDPVATLVAQFLVDLVKYKRICVGSIHLIGYSIGAEIAGATARKVKSLTNRNIGRITGLDPATPSFTCNTKHLSKEDAKFVDVIHTSLAGFQQAMGHADFYPNGGLTQPGCSTYITTCSHAAAPYFFVQSINSQTIYLARKCTSYSDYLLGECDNCASAYMGEWVSPKARGSFYLTTDATCGTTVLTWMKVKV